MSHLPGLSDYVGKKKHLLRIERAAESNNHIQQKGELSEISDELQIKNLFSGMNRSLSMTTARVARNKKVKM